MPEYWFRYGVTEVSLEVSEEVWQKRLEPCKRSVPEDVAERLGEFVEDILLDSGSKRVTILYDYPGDDESVIVLKALMDEIHKIGSGLEINLVSSAWRLEPAIGRRFLMNLFKRNDLRIEPRLFLDAGLSTDLKDEVWRSSPVIVVTSAEPHGLFGSFSIREVLLFPRLKNLRNPLNHLNDLWEALPRDLDLYGICMVGDELLMGEAGKIDLEARAFIDQKFGREAEKAEIVVAGAGGAPRDLTLETCAHLLGLLSDFVREGGLIGLVAECGGGLGSKNFLEALTKRRGIGLEGMIADLIMRVEEEKRIVLTSTIPKSLLNRLAGIRGFDVVQDLITYALRIYSKDARILIAEDGLLKTIKTRKTGRS